jgi:hypothetical protein
MVMSYVTAQQKLRDRERKKKKSSVFPIKQQRDQHFNKVFTLLPFLWRNNFLLLTTMNASGDKITNWIESQLKTLNI